MVTNSDLAGYNVYSGSASDNFSYGYVNASMGGTTGAPSYALTGLSDQARVHVAVTAYDTAGNESTFSARVSKFIHLQLTTIIRTRR